MSTTELDKNVEQSMKNKITIDILGPVNSGKSRISYIIKKALEEYGVECEVVDADYKDALDFHKCCSRHLGDAMDVVSKKSKITIINRQLNRETL